MPRVINVYTAESTAMKPLTVLRAMVRGLIQSRYMALRLVIKDIRSDYAKSVFGMVWELIDPLVLGLIFYWLMSTRVIEPGPTAVPYAVFIIYGLLLYATFTESVMRMLMLVQNSRALLVHTKMPPEALILSVILRILFYSAFRIAVMLIFSLALAGSAEAQGLHSFSLLV